MRHGASNRGCRFGFQERRPGYPGAIPGRVITIAEGLAPQAALAFPATARRAVAQAWNESELAWPARTLATCSSKLSLSNRETPSAIADNSASSVT